MVRNILLAAAVITMAFALASCARFRSTPSDYSVRGVTTSPEAMVREASDAHVRVRHAETYDWAVRHGMAYPYEGGYWGTDMGYHYGGQYPVAPYATPRSGYMHEGAQPATREDLERVREQAEKGVRYGRDAIKGLQGHDRWHKGQRGRR